MSVCRDPRKNGSLITRPEGIARSIWAAKIMPAGANKNHAPPNRGKHRRKRAGAGPVPGDCDGSTPVATPDFGSHRQGWRAEAVNRRPGAAAKARSGEPVLFMALIPDVASRLGLSKMVAATTKHYVVRRIVNPSRSHGRINNPSYLVNNAGEGGGAAAPAQSMGGKT